MAWVGCSARYQREEVSAAIQALDPHLDRANTTVGLKGKQELPPSCPGLLQPHHPRRAGLPRECSVPQTCPAHWELAGWQHEEQEAGNANYAETGSTCNSHPPHLAPGPGKDSRLLPGARAEGGAPCPPACLGRSLEKAGCGGRRPPPAAGKGIRMQTAFIVI